MASPCGLGFFTTGLLGSEGKHPESQVGTFCDLAFKCHIASLLLYSIDWAVTGSLSD